MDAAQSRPALLPALAVALVVIGCGGGGRARDDPPTSTTEPPPVVTSTPSSTFRTKTRQAPVGIPSGRQVCDVLRAPEVVREVTAVDGRTPRLRAEANDSYQLSVCRYAGQGAMVRVTLDGAANPMLRFYNMGTEASQIPKLFGGPPNFRLVWDVGDDHTYGGAGAFWQRDSQRLTAIRAGRIAPGHRDRGGLRRPPAAHPRLAAGPARPRARAGLKPVHLEQVAVIVEDYDEAIRFFVDVLGFELVEDSPSLTNDGRAKRWVVVRPPGAQTALLLARADGDRQEGAVGEQFAGRVGLFLRRRRLRRLPRADARRRRRVRHRAPGRAVRARRGVPRRRREPLGPARPR